MDLVEQYKAKLLLLEREKRLRDDLGYKFAHKLYKFQRDFIDSKNRMCLLTAANQLGKTSGLIIKCLNYMFSTDEWRKMMWPGTGNNDGYVPGRDRLLIWYFYPDFKTADTAFRTVWRKYLPKGIYLEEEKLKAFYWWKEQISEKKIDQIHFRDGLLQFKAYGQSSLNLQAASCHMVNCDEELPFYHYGEIKSRMNFTRGYYNQVFTATLGQKEWYDAMEQIGTPDEKFPNAWKRSVSLRDCFKYEDGSDSPWDEKRVKEIEAQYPTKEERDMRVDGRFIVQTDRLLYSSYNHRLLVDAYRIPKEWEIRCGIDIGKGGKNHKSAIVFIAINPEMTKVCVFMAWRGEGITTPRDVVDQYKKMMEKIPRKVLTFYDYHAKEFEDIMMLDDEIKMIRCDKKPEHYIGITNSLMKYGMIDFFKNDPEVIKLTNEFKLVRKDQIKIARDDNMCDAFMYSLSRCLFEFKDAKVKIDNSLVEEKIEEVKKEDMSIDAVRGRRGLKQKRENNLYMEEMQDFENSIFNLEAY